PVLDLVARLEREVLEQAAAHDGHHLAGLEGPHVRRQGAEGDPRLHRILLSFWWVVEVGFGPGRPFDRSPPRSPIQSKRRGPPAADVRAFPMKLGCRAGARQALGARRATTYAPCRAG